MYSICFLFISQCKAVSWNKLSAPIDRDLQTFLFFRYNELSRFSILCLFLKAKNKKCWLFGKVLFLCIEKTWGDLGRRFIYFAPLFSKKGPEAWVIYTCKHTYIHIYFDIIYFIYMLHTLYIINTYNISHIITKTKYNTAKQRNKKPYIIWMLEIIWTRCIIRKTHTRKTVN